MRSLQNIIRAVLAIVALLIATAASTAQAAAPLADAAENLDRDQVRSLLTESADVNAPQVDGMTALLWAAYHDDLETANLLLTAGADAKAANRYGVTALSLACTNGNAPLVKRLLEAGADANTTLRGGETALMTAARTGSLDAVKSLIEHGAEVNAKARRGQTAIVWAAAEGHAEVVQALIDGGADYRTPVSSGFTPLFFAAREGKTDVVKLLLKAGIDVNEHLKPKRRPARGPSNGTTALVLAIENGHFELARLLLEAGADPTDERTGFTPLHMITWVRKPNRGEDEDGMPPPIGSGTMTSLQLVRELVAHGADVNARLRRGASGRGALNRKGATPFLLAAMTADLPLMKLLLELGADPTINNADGCTPLMAAAGIGVLAPGEEAAREPEAIATINFLIELGADVNTIDKNGETAMHGAAYKMSSKIAELLAEKGAKVEIWNRKNDYGWTPLAIAEGYRPGNFRPSPETIVVLHRLLIAAGITPPATSKPATADNNYE